MPPKSDEKRRSTDDCVDIVSFVQLKQTLVVLASVFSIVMVLVPIILTRMFDKIDDLNKMYTTVAVIQEKMSHVESDVKALKDYIEKNPTP